MYRFCNDFSHWLLCIAAQVVSGIGFLGAGMIIVKNNNLVIGLTTAAGMWATASIGIALGYGFYSGAIIATVFLSTTISSTGISDHSPTKCTLL